MSWALPWGACSIDQARSGWRTFSWSPVRSYHWSPEGGDQLLLLLLLRCVPGGRCRLHQGHPQPSLLRLNKPSDCSCSSRLALEAFTNLGHSPLDTLQDLYFLILGHPKLSQDSSWGQPSPAQPRVGQSPLLPGWWCCAWWPQGRIGPPGSKALSHI